MEYLSSSNPQSLSASLTASQASSGQASSVVLSIASQLPPSHPPPCPPPTPINKLPPPPLSINRYTLIHALISTCPVCNPPPSSPPAPSSSSFSVKHAVPTTATSATLNSLIKFIEKELKQKMVKPSFCPRCKSILSLGGKYWSREMFEVSVDSTVKLSKSTELPFIRRSDGATVIHDGDCLKSNTSSSSGSSSFCVNLPGGTDAEDKLFHFALAPTSAVTSTTTSNTTPNTTSNTHYVDLTSPPPPPPPSINTKPCVTVHLIPRGKLSSKRIEILLKKMAQYQSDNELSYVLKVGSKDEMLRSSDSNSGSNVIIVENTLKLDSLLQYYDMKSFEEMSKRFKANNVKVVHVEWFTKLSKGDEAKMEEYGWQEWRNAEKELKDKRSGAAGRFDISSSQDSSQQPSPKWMTKKRKEVDDAAFMPAVKVRKASEIDNPMINSVRNDFELDEFQLEDDVIDLVLQRAKSSGAIQPIDEGFKLKNNTTVSASAFATSSFSSAAAKVPKCECLGIPSPAVLRTSEMRGPNQGLQFYACSKTVAEGCCNFFQLKNKIEESVNSDRELELLNDVVSSQGSNSNISQHSNMSDTPSPQTQQTTDGIRETVSRKKINSETFAFSMTREKMGQVVKANAADDADANASADEMHDDLQKLPSKSTSGDKLYETNLKVADFLNKLSKAHSVGNTAIKADKFRIYTYKKAASRVRTWGEELNLDVPECWEKLAACKGPPGANTIQKVKEFLLSGTCGRLEGIKNDDWRKGINEIGNVWGIGPETSIVFVNMGYNTVAKLREAVARGDRNVTLTAQQKIGLRLYEDLMEPCPRSEITSIGDRVQKTVQKIFPSTTVDIMGSYRRGAASGHDVDCLLTSPDFKDKLPQGCLQKVITALTKEGVLTDHLSMPSEKGGVMTSFRRKSPAFDKSEIPAEAEAPTAHLTYSYMGIAKLGKHHRRIDIKFYPYNQKPFAQLYFTGNAYFNRSMRLYAKMVGYSLSDHGLCKTSRKKISGKWYVTAKQASLVAKTEKDVFDLLGLKWVEPADRNAYDAVAEAKMEEPDEVEDEELSQLSQPGSVFSDDQSFVEKIESPS
ncbi:hypothetical protein TrVE_jg2930 [Triparma verrucosa]|uniref:GRF-type domain-containing protein n=1 Tax=Triparma verrucosa TaxID=1606542 RepID=A0A9W7FCS0_9STRA|nr:hypothetical protein TrVE_jg2930 [Triparma verrucosa]